MPREDVEIQDLIRENRRYYNQVRDGNIPFNYAEYQRKINLLPARAAEIYPEYGLNYMKYLMRGRHNGNPYSFRRNDVTEAAKLYYNMKNLPRYRIQARFGDGEIDDMNKFLF